MNDREERMAVICREVSRDTGEVAVYRLDMEVTRDLLFVLGIKARANPELRYFVITEYAWSVEGCRQALSKLLKKRTLNKSHLDAIGGIQEL